MVTTGARSSKADSSNTPPEVEYWVLFRRGDYHGGPAYTGTYGFDWVEWKRNSANNPTTSYDQLTSVMGTAISHFAECYDPGLPAAGLQPATPPHYVPVNSNRSHYEQELHRGYDKAIIHSNDYYVPWLSLRPHQTVKLKLEIAFLNKEPVKPTNLFTVAAHPDYVVTINGQTNNAPAPATPAPTPVLSTTTSSSTLAPAAPAPAVMPIRLPPVNKQVLDVTIECLRPSAATNLRVEDERKNLVGQLNIVDNTNVYELPLRVVYVLRGVPHSKKDVPGSRTLYAPKGALARLQQPFEALDFITYLNTYTLNQALITCVLQAPPPSTIPGQPAPPFQVLIDEDYWKAQGYWRGGVLQQPDNVPAFCEKFANAAYGPFGGITLFVHELDRSPGAQGPIAASGSITPVGAKTLSVFNTGLT